MEDEVSKRVINKVETCSQYPFHYLEMLKGYPYYKLRVGDYRVIVDLDKEEEELTIVLAGHRDDVYKKLDRKASDK